MTRRLLIVAMPDSPHVAKWINLIIDQGWDIHLFPVFQCEPVPVHYLMRDITVHLPWIRIDPENSLRKLIYNPKLLLSLGNTNKTRVLNNISFSPVYPIPVNRPIATFLNKLKSKKLGESDVRAPLPYGPHVLARLIKKLKPDLIHAMEFQHAGYNVLRAREIMGSSKFPKWLVTNWGSDIYYYSKLPDHRQQIARLLKSADYYSCECERDVSLALEMGMTAKPMPVLPNTGGFDIESISSIRQEIRPSQRRMIMVKGYQHFAGRALTALDSLSLCSDILKDYQIVIYSASSEVRNRAEELRLSHGLNINILEYSVHEKILHSFAHARIYLGVSISDAISTSMLEAMAMGAFPIQTNTSCCNEWIKDGESGFSIPADDIQVIANRIRQAITNDKLVDDAADINWLLVCKKLDQRILQMKQIELYERIFLDLET